MKLAAYRLMVVTWARAFTAYRFDTIFRLLVPAIQILMLIELWNAVYGGRDVVAGMPPRATMLAYLTVINIQTWVTRTIIHGDIPQRISEGGVATDLLRPMPFPGQMVAKQAGFTLGQLPIFAISLVLAMAVGLISLPVSFLYVPSLLLGCVVGTLVALLLGYVSFWTLETEGALWAYGMISAFFAGAYIPLDLLPDVVRPIFHALPFQAMGYTPVAIYTGLLGGEAMWRALAVQVGWIVVLVPLAALVWRRAALRVTVQGG
ncbi:ABC transporter permease [Nonomuraea africana]|uniref:ABC-2 type transport system permease protein n=1 Tax=Nonomuraea africana TaxID=46171 RepID=A0ABR9KNY0_9ACTN|nr:ABC-2 family transporter protein [Nonomuraea africana]MBE1563734.1 ABC-2 type transport system permease protein [Nonomuraea africana]